MERETVPGSPWKREGDEAGPSTGSGRPRPSSYRALRSAVSSLARMEDFYCEKIGSGFFSDVLKVRHRQSGQVMVLKLNKVESNRGNMLREVQMMNRLSHPNILRFMGACVHQGQLHALTEYINGGNLEQLLNSSEPLPWSLRVKLALDIAYGLHYLHSKDIFHRDLTSKNCLVRRETSGYTAIVGDFGLAEKIPVCRSVGSIRHKEPLPVVGSPYWMAPEVLRADFYNETADVFSYGIILCEIIARIPADPDYMPRTEDYGLDVTAFRSMVETSCPVVFLELAFSCCNMEPTLRPSVIDISRCLEDVLQEQRCTEGAKTMPSVSDHTKRSPLRDLAAQQQLDQSLSHSQSASYICQLHTPCSGARTKEATPRVNPFSHRKDLKGGKIKLFTPSKLLTPRPAIKQRDFSATAAQRKCYSLSPTLKLHHRESLVLDVRSPHPSDDPQCPDVLPSLDLGESTFSSGAEEWQEGSSEPSELPQSSTPRPDSILSCTSFSDTQNETVVVSGTPLESLHELSSPCVIALEQTDPALVLSESSSSALGQHEVLPCSHCQGAALRPSSKQNLICEAESSVCHHQKGPGPAEPSPKLPERKS
ncbi:TESK1 kinase, partial [Tricholaema leucomelas]|nr:TESK1 kinase [Tricholaema leucomelas]